MKLNNKHQWSAVRWSSRVNYNFYEFTVFKDSLCVNFGSHYFKYNYPPYSSDMAPSDFFFKNGRLLLYTRHPKKLHGLCVQTIVRACKVVGPVVDYLEKYKTLRF